MLFISKIATWGILASAFCYAILAVYVLFAKNEKERITCFRLQLVLCLLQHFLGYFVIVAKLHSRRALVIYFVELCFLLFYVILYKKVYKNAYMPLISNMIFLLTMGFIMLYRLNPAKAQSQVIFFLGVGLLSLSFPVFTRKIKAAKAWAGTIGVLGLLLLISVLLLGKLRGTEEFGANLSLKIGPLRFQPSELVKITYVLFVAVLFRNRTDLRRVAFGTLIALLHLGVLVLSNDLGGAAIFFGAYLAMVYIATEKKRYPLIGLFLFSAMMVPAYILFAHVRVRVQAWLDPWSIIQGKGYQMAQSLFSIANGGFTGTGLYNGLPEAIPVVTKDFIFSAISEEMGAVTAWSMTVVLVSTFLMFMNMAKAIHVTFYKLIGTGLAVIFGIQVFLSIGGNIKFIPSTGVTIPLVSYGGSSIVSSFLLFGMMQGLYIMVKNEEERRSQMKEGLKT